MAQAYKYRIDVSEHGAWHTQVRAEDRTVDDREPVDIARAVIEDWILSRKGVAGGGRVTVQGTDPLDLPPEESAKVRVFVFLDESEPAATAYLIADPEVADPDAWVNP